MTRRPSDGVSRQGSCRRATTARWLFLAFLCSAYAVAQDPDTFDWDRVVAVRVVDAAGRPLAGVPVVAVFPFGERFVPAVFGTRFGTSPWSAQPLVVSAVSDATGTCALELIRGGVPLVMLAGAIGAERIPVEVRLGAPIPEARSTRFEMGHLPKEPVTLVCPASVPLHVRIVDAKGGTDSRPAVVSVARLAQAPSAMTSEAIGMRGATVAAKDGVARFSRVGAGQRVRVAAQVETETRPRFAEVQIPADADATRSMDVALSPADAGADVDLALRVLAPSGKPLANTHVVVNVVTEPSAAVIDPHRPRPTGGSLWRAIALDTEGRARIRIPEFADPDPLVQVRVAVGVGPSLVGTWRRRGEIVVPRGLRPGVDDVGDVRIPPAAVVASGSVVDSDLAPVPGAMITVECNRRTMFGIEFTEATDRVKEMAFTNWVPVAGLEAVSGMDGRFTIRGVLPSGELRLVASRRGFYQPGGRPFTAGRRDVQLIVLRGAEIRGEILVDEGVPIGSIRVEVTGEFERDVTPDRAAPGWSGESMLETFRANRISVAPVNGRFAVTPLPPGKATVTVLVSDVEVCKVEGLDVIRGASIVPTELGPLDLRGKTTVRRVVVTDETGKPIPDATITFMQRAAKMGPARARTDERGVARLATVGADPLSVSVRGPDGGRWNSSNLADMTLDAKATLHHPAMVRVRLRNPEAVTLPPYWVACVLTAAAWARRSGS